MITVLLANGIDIGDFSNTIYVVCINGVSAQMELVSLCLELKVQFSGILWPLILGGCQMLTLGQVPLASHADKRVYLKQTGSTH